MEPGADPTTDAAELPVPVGHEPGQVDSVELVELDAARAEAVAGGMLPPGHDLTAVLDVPVELAVEIGRTRMTIRDTLSIAPGSLIALDRVAGEPVDLLVNGRRIARGEVVAIDEEFGLRVTEVVSPELRLDAA
jgi:flagellar motor switch protein FliN/FliY